MKSFRYTDAGGDPGFYLGVGASLRPGSDAELFMYRTLPPVLIIWVGLNSN